MSTTPSVTQVNTPTVVIEFNHEDGGMCRIDLFGAEANGDSIRLLEFWACLIVKTGTDAESDDADTITIEFLGRDEKRYEYDVEGRSDDLIGALQCHVPKEGLQVSFVYVHWTYRDASHKLLDKPIRTTMLKTFLFTHT